MKNTNKGEKSSEGIKQPISITKIPGKMTFIRYILFFSLLITSCARNRFFYYPVTHIKKEGLDIHISKGFYYYNAFERRRDSMLIFNSNFDLVSTPVTTKLSIRNGRGKLECFVFDSIKCYECDILDKKINGVCVKFFSPEFKDIAQKGEFTNNKLNGYYKAYNANGSLLFHELYKKGKLKYKYEVP